MASKKLSPEQKRRAAQDAIRLFILLCAVVYPATVRYMDALGISRVEDIRVMIADLEVLALNRRKGVRIPPDTLKDSNTAISSLCHVNKRAIDRKKFDYIDSWKDMMRFMGNKEAVRVLRRYETFKGPQPNPETYLKDKSDMNISLLKCIKMYKILVLEVTPPIGRIMITITQDPDPYIMLKRMVEKAAADPSWINGNNALTSFNGRNKLGHFQLTDINSKEQIYIQAWSDVCEEKGEVKAASDIRSRM